jgi:hypothetical protein
LNAATLVKTTDADGDFVDDVHFNQRGADKIAAIWFDALVRNKLVPVSRRSYLASLKRGSSGR